MSSVAKVATVDDVKAALAAHDYLADEGLATSIFLAITLRRPLFLEGEAGVGKTEVAKVLSRWLGGPFIRLQCYEGIDANQAVFEWDHARQLLHLRTAEAAGRIKTEGAGQLESELYDEQFLIRRPLLQALSPTDDGSVPVLLIDEVDRADDEFEAFLLEALSDYSVTVPQLGTITAADPPIVVLTSNRTRDVHDALKRRCLYHWVEHPDFAREVAIVRLRAPSVGEALARQVAAATEAVRSFGLYKPPGVAETIDWAMSLAALGRTELDEASVAATLGSVLKYREDHDRVAEKESMIWSRPRWPEPEVEVPPAEGERLSVGFARVLRNAGVKVPASATINYTNALGATGLDDVEHVYWAGRATLLTRPEDQPLYDQAFSAYWRQRYLDGLRVESAAQPVTLLLDSDEDQSDSDNATGDETDGDDIEAVRFSRVEILTEKDFGACTEAELAELTQMMSRLRFTTHRRQSRRQIPTKSRTSRHDLERTVRLALRNHGEPMRWANTTNAWRPRRLILILDVSGSMESYARALLRFAHAAVVARNRVEVFTLGTRLTRVTRQLSNRDPDAALRAVTPEVVDWSGGTRLGEVLRDFNDRWGIKGMARGSVVVLLSDGWDRGDASVLGEQMQRLHRVTNELIWVNPLKASPGYAPLAAGMAAALPHADRFVAGNTYRSLADLADLLSTESRR